MTAAVVVVGAGRSRPIAVRAAVVLLAVGASACSNEPARSAEAFCSTMQSEQMRIRTQFDSVVAAGEATGDQSLAVLIGLGGSAQALGELRTYFDKLAAVAPEEIRVEAEIVAETYSEQLDNAGDIFDSPLGTLGSLLIGGLSMSGHLDALDHFAVENCGAHI